MACRLSLRASSASTAASTLPSVRLRLLPQQAAKSRALFALVPSRYQRDLSTSLLRRVRPFSTSSVSSSASAQPKETAPTSNHAIEKPQFLSEGESQVWDRLVAEFAPTQLVVQDISGGCGSMYGIDISSEKFRGLSMLKQQRLVNAALGDLMKGWHGVQLKTRAP